MLRRSLQWLLLSRPVSQGHIADLPPPLPEALGKQWARAVRGNTEVRSFYAPDAERYDAWYKETYGIEDLSDGCAASGSASNKLLDDSRNIMQAKEEYDLKGIAEELEFWSTEFQHNTQMR